MRYRLLIAYDGTAYQGWQRQPAVPTVVGTLEDAYRRVFKRPISIIGASRTDAGVHARGQVAAATLDLDLDPDTLMRAWSASLPLDIQIVQVVRVPDTFHPQRNVRYKRYIYRVCMVRPAPDQARYVAYYARPLTVELLQKACNVLVGTHDFRSFCTGHDRGDDTIRRIDSINIVYDKRRKIYTFTFQGPGFLRYMIRRIVGGVMQVVSDDIVKKSDTAVDRLQKILQERNPAQQLVTAPARGLLLDTIVYR